MLHIAFLYSRVIVIIISSECLYDSVKCIELVQNIVQKRVFVKMLMNLQIL